jgi:3-oxoacyl-(acyl-carrier-protein) synthase
MRVAIAGCAWRTPLGSAIDAAVSRLLAGERAAIANPRAEGFACSVAASISDPPAVPRQARFLRPLGLYGLEVAREALALARPALVDDGRGDRLGLFSAVGGLRAHWDDMMAGLAHQREDGEAAWARGLFEVHPYWMLRHLSNNVHALVSAELGLRGEGATFGGSNASAQAIAAAARGLRAGAIDAALVVAYDSLLEPETLVELGARRAATHARAGELVAPYDRRAAGFVPGEAAAALVLVAARDTGATLVDAVDGADGAHAEPEPSTIARVVRPLLSRDAIAIIDGAARAWPDVDASERAAIGELVGANTPLTAITAAMGQLGAATSAVQAIALAECLRRGVLPPIAGLAEPAAGPLVPLAATVASNGRFALAISSGAPGLVGAIRVEVPR